MPTYAGIISGLPYDGSLTESEKISLSSKYNGWTLFLKHYHYHRKSDEPLDDVDDLVSGFDCVLSMDMWDNDDDLTVSSQDSGSVSSCTFKFSEFMASVSKMWNELSAIDQERCRDRANKVNYYPPIGYFSDLPEVLSRDRVLSLD